MTTDPYHACRSELCALLARSPAVFKELFHAGQTSRTRAKLDEGPFLELGLIERDLDNLYAKVAITNFRGTYIASDFVHSPALDRVFPVYPDESYLLAMWPRITDDDVVLDLCTGSGIIAILAKKRGAERVIASDITERSKSFFNLNIRLNMCDDIEFVSSDILDDIPEDTFTLVTCNPPFVPIPANRDYFVHSAGGPLGTSLVERVLGGIQKFGSQARLYMTCLSLGSEMSWRIADLYEQASDEGASFLANSHLHDIYDDNSISFDRYFLSLPEHHRDIAWSEETARLGYDRLGYFGLAAGCVDSYIERQELKRAIEDLRRQPPFGALDAYCWSLERRLQRYNAHAVR